MNKNSICSCINYSQPFLLTHLVYCTYLNKLILSKNKFENEEARSLKKTEKNNSNKPIFQILPSEVYKLLVQQSLVFLSTTRYSHSVSHGRVQNHKSSMFHFHPQECYHIWYRNAQLFENAKITVSKFDKKLILASFRKLFNFQKNKNISILPSIELHQPIVWGRKVRNFLLFCKHVLTRKLSTNLRYEKKIVTVHF